MTDRLRVRGIGLGALLLAILSLVLPGARNIFLLLYLVATLGFFILARNKDILGFWILTVAHGLLAIGLLFGGGTMALLWMIGLPAGLLGFINLINLVEWQDIF